jgi:hypothetical protein
MKRAFTVASSVALISIAALSLLWLMNFGMKPFWRPFAPISLVSITLHNPKTGKVVECPREQGAPDGGYETLEMKACIARDISMGFVQGLPHRKNSN